MILRTININPNTTYTYMDYIHYTTEYDILYNSRNTHTYIHTIHMRNIIHGCAEESNFNTIEYNFYL